MICPTERKADFDAERLLITGNLLLVDIFVDTKILCIYRCFSYFLTGVNKNIQKTFNSILENRNNYPKKVSNPMLTLALSAYDKLPAGTEANLSLSGTGKKGNR